MTKSDSNRGREKKKEKRKFYLNHKVNLYNDDETTFYCRYMTYKFIEKQSKQSENLFHHINHQFQSFHFL